MKPAYLAAASGHRDRWMISYVDVLTILLVFFLVAAGKSLETKPLPVPPTIAHAETELPRADLIRARQLLLEQGLEANLEARGLIISLPNIILFSSGDDTVAAEAFPALERLAQVLRDIPNGVRLIGHADMVPIHNGRFHSNWDLSMARSLRILELLCKRYGVPEGRLSIAGYGPYRPTAPNDTSDGRAANRRVEIVILDESPAPDAQSVR
jgi:chemotaxis protein MotB